MGTRIQTDLLMKAAQLYALLILIVICAPALCEEIPSRPLVVDSVKSDLRVLDGHANNGANGGSMKKGKGSGGKGDKKGKGKGDKKGKGGKGKKHDDRLLDENDQDIVNDSNDHCDCPHHKKKGSKTTKMYVLISGIVIASLVLITISLWCYCKKHAKKDPKEKPLLGCCCKKPLVSDGTTEQAKQNQDNEDLKHQAFEYPNHDYQAMNSNNEKKPVINNNWAKVKSSSKVTIDIDRKSGDNTPTP